MKAYSYIRFSSPEQLKGDSLRRQTEATQQYCKRNGYNLDESLSMKDLGLSAFHGTHLSGALGEFLKLVETGKIESGSVLIVENLDRLSRQTISTALAQFTNIINAGIKLVTLSDNMEYSKESINSNWAQLVISISYMARAHDESAMKSMRLKSAWSNKQKLARENNKVMSKKIPIWLRVVNGKFEPIDEVVEVVKKIYEMRLNSMGPDLISIKLNQMDVWKPNRGWKPSSVNNILYYSSIIGEYQPFTSTYNDKNKKKRVKTGDPIQNYYPAVIDRETWQAVQNYNQKVTSMKGNAGGRISKGTNLFAHVIKCSICGGAMHYVSNGYPTLHCDISRRKTELNGIKCNAKAVNYAEFEKEMFENLDQINVQNIFGDNTDLLNEVNQLEKQVESINYELNESQLKMENLIDALSSENKPAFRQALKSKWESLEQKTINLRSQISQTSFKIVELQSNEKNIDETLNSSNSIYEMLKGCDNEEKAIEMRFKLRSLIQKLIKSILIEPLDRKYKPLEYDDDLSPNLMIATKSKSIKKIRIKFNGSKQYMVLSYQHIVDTNELD